MFFLDPPKQVVGHPVELLEILAGTVSSGATAHLWRVKVRVVFPDRTPVVAYVRYAEDRRIMFEKFPDDIEALRALIIVRGRGDHSLSSSNPLAEAIEAVVGMPAASPQGAL